MINYNQISAKIQTKLKQNIYRYKSHLKLPEYKFLSDMIFGMLKGKHIHLAKISRTLLEEITPQKTQERLSYHLSKQDFYKKLQNIYYETNRHKINRCHYLIFDGSDIIKEEAKTMEGLSLVRDGSRSGSNQKIILKNGYHWDNIIGVSSDGKELVPIYSEIYSGQLDADYAISENRKIINVLKDLREQTKSEQILVVDRGGDRRVLLTEFIEDSQFFVIRQTGKRHLYYQGRSMPLKEISRKVILDKEYTVIRNHNKKTVKHLYHVGAVPVKLPTSCLKYEIDHLLWLVVVKEHGKGYSWFLCNLPTTDKVEAIDLMIKGYQYRWKVEEFHRQVKQDYHLEDIRYQKYESIKTIGSLLVFVIGFLSTLNKEFIKLVLFVTKLLEKNNFINIPKYIFYRLTEGVRILLAGVHKSIPKKSKIGPQTILNLFP